MRPRKVSEADQWSQQGDLVRRINDLIVHLARRVTLTFTRRFGKACQPVEFILWAEYDKLDVFATPAVLAARGKMRADDRVRTT